jgi:hypothetical protein
MYQILWSGTDVSTKKTAKFTKLDTYLSSNNGSNLGPERENSGQKNYVQCTHLFCWSIEAVNMQTFI